MIADLFVIIGTIYLICLPFIFGAPLSVKILMVLAVGMPCICATSDLLGAGK